MSIQTLHASQTLSAAQRASLRREVKGLFRRYDTSGNGTINETELAPLIEDLTGRKPTKNEVLFALRAIDVNDDGSINEAEFRKYWESVRLGADGSGFNKLLVRDLVGAVRTSTYTLPPRGHAFGYTGKTDNIGTREVLGEWQSSDSAARATRHPRPEKVDHSSKTHGKQTRPSTPIHELIRCGYAGEGATAKDTIYPEKPKRVKKDVPVARTTAASTARMVLTQQRKMEESGSREPWKMKKFSHVQPKLRLPGGSRPSR